ncbi:hypothetical protein A3C24_05025 [Candidatus Roizmanbacteria bacterium RIFCSPHIGHO2_02_FULL_37_24]|uniref:Uncharacterized protein n=1 Tax=Candidatus Roizmanbacteria bacterium RIFCSPHIGHO2_02_FULL_37_24 TaxID=1802037 RepID=A0A1F7GV17_9BACT|nr:MAG: hypothetical protein A3C24_05025 [Candidatus Roizmanbacteria bacterium RIFCSPHIGHO2_02_FULL_37_24]OGK61829.1 MAG: hypothetical protein A3G65_04180 [Candidatus Roizmanbacteria bacterium RIFCSPLOWO2_12_FULL_37_7b]
MFMLRVTFDGLGVAPDVGQEEPAVADEAERVPLYADGGAERVLLLGQEPLERKRLPPTTGVTVAPEVSQVGRANESGSRVRTERRVASEFDFPRVVGVAGDPGTERYSIPLAW